MATKPEDSTIPALGRRIDVYLLRYFLAVVEHGEITRAAESLYLAQPSLSQAIRTLENRLGTTLLNRSTRPIGLTPAGTRLVPAARALLGDFEDARLAVEAVKGLRAGRVDLVTHPVFAVEPLVDLVRRFRVAHENIVVNVHTADTAESAKELVRNGTAELAIGYYGTEDRDLRVIPLSSHEVVLVGSPDVIGTECEQIPGSSIADIPVVLDISDRGTEAMVRKLIGRNRTPRHVVSCSTPRLLWGLVSRGTGATLLPRGVAEQYLPHSVAVSLYPPLYRTPALFTRVGSLSSAATAFADLASPSPAE